MSKKTDPNQGAMSPETTDGSDDPIGACRFTNASGQSVCLDNVTKSECDQILNSIFIEGGACE